MIIFAIEIVILNYVLRTFFGFSTYYEQFKFIKILTIVIAIDLLFVIYFLYQNDKEKKIPKNIFKTYKLDINSRLPKVFFITEVIKAVLILNVLRVNDVYFSSGIIIILVLHSVMLVMYAGLYSFIANKSYIHRKLRKYTKDLKKGKTKLNFILINGNHIPSSFSVGGKVEQRIQKNNVYIDVKKDLPRLLEYEKNIAEKFIKENTVAIINEVNEIDKNKIVEIYNENQKQGNIATYSIISVNSKENIINEKEIIKLNAIKLCKLDATFELIEELTSRDKNEWNTTMYHNFYNKQKDNTNVIPKDKRIYDIYKNAYLCSSQYESILGLFNYITVIGRVTMYYLFAKNNKKFDPEKCERNLMGDNPSFWMPQIILNVYKNKESILYKNIREKVYHLSIEDNVLVDVYLANLLNIEIQGTEGITYSALEDLFVKFRNKVEAHGIITDLNVDEVWSITVFFAKTFSKILKIDELEGEYGLNEKSLKIGYNDEDKVSLGKYVITVDNEIYIIKDRKKQEYINYSNGKVFVLDKIGERK